jgi:ankyrin repeat protein
MAHSRLFRLGGADNGGRTKFVGFNALLTAAYYCSSTEIVDFLLEKGCNPSERDARGYVKFLCC